MNLNLTVDPSVKLVKANQYPSSLELDMLQMPPLWQSIYAQLFMSHLSTLSWGLSQENDSEDEYDSSDEEGYKPQRTEMLLRPVPSIFNYLTNLTYCQLEGCGMKGLFPSEITKCVKLEYLSFCRNFLSGSIPANIGDLIELRALYLDANNLTGSLPVSMGSLIHLEAFTCGEGNSLTGPIPPELGNLLNLRVLVLRENFFEGTVPVELAKLKALERLDLSKNPRLDVQNVPIDILAMSALTFETVLDFKGLENMG
ncbi:hypothetical protein HDU79_008236 [Rhizoclosmatium sp. JEL0117]|nr:hypothetical protein HDU79_008236 [Rhizoclosmatium sp. JEL0117]